VADGFILVSSLILLLLIATWPAFIPVVVSALGVAFLSFYAVGGLLLSKAPRAVWCSLLMLPVYALWKIRLYVRLLVKGGPTAWVRTDRDQ